MSSNPNLDLILTRKSPFSMKEFRNVINDDMVASVVAQNSDKRFQLCYEVKLLNNATYKVYVKMTTEQIFKAMQNKN
jgi:hypothetical protein